eukprot:TRINITY_DN19571_c0_g1_i2.p1 TRINITY_DN19571_c0_g1~~TRINITY_DN19571_c0_g1_i2.p1  ORF type:complete len:129 (+),score=17.06 TRINITY_DN19571_c0_g1_i2:344-730(+)
MGTTMGTTKGTAMGTTMGTTMDTRMGTTMSTALGTTMGTAAGTVTGATSIWEAAYGFQQIFQARSETYPKYQKPTTMFYSRRIPRIGLTRSAMVSFDLPEVALRRFSPRGCKVEVFHQMWLGVLPHVL